MKKRLLAFALTLAMVVTSLSMLSFVSFAEVAPDVDDDANEAATLLVAEIDADGEAVDIASIATATASYSVTSANLTIKVSGANLTSVKATVGGYATTVAATDGAATITVALKNVVIYKDAIGTAIADLQLVATTSEATETFDGTLAFNIVIPEQEVVNAEQVFGTDKSWVQQAGVAGGGTYLNFMMGDAAALMNAETERTVKFTLTVNTMEEVNIDTIQWGSNWSANMELSQRISFSYFTDSTEYHGAVLFQIHNTSNGLYLVYKNFDGTLTKYALDAELGEALDFELVLGYPTYGYIKVNDEIIVEKDDIRSALNEDITNGGGCYAMGFVGTKNPYQAYNVSITNKTIATKTPRVDADISADDIVALGASTTPVGAAGSIKLSYVQESYAYSESAALSSVASGGGGTVSADKSTLTVANTALRALAQGRFNVLQTYGNRNINFKLNVTSLNAYDFSKGGTVEDGSKYDALTTTYGQTAGIGADVSGAAKEFDRLLIGAVAVDSYDGMKTVAMAFCVVNDTTDGLVLVHTDIDGNETVIKIGNKIGQDINVSIVWNTDNTGSVKIDSEDAISFTECRTVYTDYTTYIANGGTGTGAPQCYFAGIDSIYGYFGINATWDNDNTNAAPNAALTLTDVSVEDPLAVRFIATIDSINAKEAGFEINLKGSDKVVPKSTDVAYKAIATNAGLDKISAPDGKYFIAITINNVPADETVTFVVKPYIIYAGDAETTYGTAYEVTYVNGVYSGAVAVAN